ncbi:MAG: LysR family transcriptional regulator [Pseudomonadota bacterium]
MLDWTAVRDFLAVAEHGSLSAAARQLKISQPTLGRRITALEEILGAELFVRGPRGLDLTPTGEAILERAKGMREEALALERAATGNDQSLTGTVRISVTEIIGAEWLTEQMAPFLRRFPQITVEMSIDNAAADILRRQADIAVRMFDPTEPDLIATKVGIMRFGLYAARDYLATYGVPRSAEDLLQHRFILPGERLMSMVRQRWLDTRAYEERAAFRANSAIALSTALMNGYGVGLQAAILAWRADNLVRVMPALEYPPSNIWLVTHADLRRSARIRAAFSYLKELFEENRRLFDELPDGALSPAPRPSGHPQTGS